MAFSFTPGSSGLKPSNMGNAYIKATPQVAEAPFARAQALLAPVHPATGLHIANSLPFRKASCLAQAPRTAPGTVRSRRTRIVSKSRRRCYTPTERTSQPGKKQGGVEARALPTQGLLQTPPTTCGVAALYIRDHPLDHPSAPHICHSVQLPGLGGR